MYYYKNFYFLLKKQVKPTIFTLAFICILWVFLETALLTGLYFHYKIYNPYLRDGPGLPSLFIIKRLTLLAGLNNQTHGSKYFLEGGDIKKIVFDDKYIEMIEKIYGKNIKEIRDTWLKYDNYFFSYRPNFLDHLITQSPDHLETETTNLVVKIDSQGGRAGIRNKSREECWVFGGSTVWGDKIAGNDTITSYLNKIQSKINFLNYGVPGYHSNTQLKYLIWLLKRRNYTPACVIWLDGLNDSTNAIQYPTIRSWDSTSHAQRFQLSPYQQKDLSKINLNIFDTLNRTPDAIEKLETLQKYDLVTLHKLNTSFKEAIFINEIKLDGTELFFKESALNHYKNAELAKVITERFAKARFYWFIQPNGEQNKTNPFLLPSYFESNIYIASSSYYKELLKISNGIAIDLTNVGKDCNDCYIDQAHYSPNMSEIVAKEMWHKLGK
jgi:hypothetical protein